MIAAPLFHSWGFAHFSLALGARRSTMVLRPAVRPRGDPGGDGAARCTALVVVPVMLQRILELPAEVIARYDLSALRVIAASGARCPASWPCGSWTASATSSTTSTARPRWRGRRSRRPRTCARRRAPPAGRRAAPRSGSSTTTAARCPDGGTGRIFVGNEMVVRGLHRRRRQGGRRRPAVHRRRRPLRRRGAPVRRRPRRRDDRLRRRERLPARGRGRPGRPRGRPGGGRGRRRGRAVRPAPAGVRRAAPTGARPTPTSSRPTSSARWPATRSRATSCSCPSCRATPRARCSSATSPLAPRGS